MSNRSIRRYRWRGPRRPPSQTWRTFVPNHAHRLWAADLFTVPTLTFKTLYVLVFIARGRRELVHINVMANPTAAWAWRQVIEATPLGQQAAPSAARSRRQLRRDFRRRARRMGIDGHRHARSGTACERSRRESDRDASPRVSGPHHRAGRAAPGVGADRIRPLLQPGPAASNAPIADAGSEAAPCDWPHPVAPSPERTAPRL